MYAAMLPRWAAVILIGFFLAITGTCFTLSMLARAEAGEATKCAAVQGKEIEFLRRDVGELKDQCREILAILRERDREQK
jgi:hypothetical protein